MIFQDKPEKSWEAPSGFPRDNTTSQVCWLTIWVPGILPPYKKPRIRAITVKVPQLLQQKESAKSFSFRRCKRGLNRCMKKTNG